MPNAIVLSDKRQPRYAVGINRSNVLSRGLVGAIHFGWQHTGAHNPALINREIVTGISTPASFAPRSAFNMQGLGAISVTSGHVKLASETDLGLTGMTMYLLCRYRDTTNRASTAFGPNAAGTNTRRAGSHMPFSDGTVYWDFGGAAGVNRLTWAITKDTKKLQRFCFVAGLGGMQLWNNGVLRASSSTTVTRTDAPDNTFYLFQGNDNTTQNTDQVEIFLALLWKRPFSSGEFRLLDSDPWQLFSASDINRSFVPAAAVAPSTSGKIAGFGGFAKMGA